MDHFKEVGIASKVNIKIKLRKIAYPNKTYLCAPYKKVNMKDVENGRATKFARSSKQIPSYFDMWMHYIYSMIVLKQ